MSLFIQPQYQTFPLPARRSPFEDRLCWGAVSPRTSSSRGRTKGKELETPQECSLKQYSSTTWGEDEIPLQDIFPGWGIFFLSQVNVTVNKDVTWMGWGQMTQGTSRSGQEGWGLGGGKRSLGKATAFLASVGLKKEFTPAKAGRDAADTATSSTSLYLQRTPWWWLPRRPAHVFKAEQQIECSPVNWGTGSCSDGTIQRSAFFSEMSRSFLDFRDTLLSFKGFHGALMSALWSSWGGWQSSGCSSLEMDMTQKQTWFCSSLLAGAEWQARPPDSWTRPL